MDEMLDIRLAGEDVRLFADRALYWPARRRLLVADVHLGKDDAFRAAGIALPAGGARHDLERLGTLLRGSGARELWVLGDLLHGGRVDAHWRQAWQAFREAHADTDMLLVEGNHDRAAANAGLDLPMRRGRVDDGPFTFSHAPLDGLEPDRIGICGHVHPVVNVPGFRGRFPAFARIGQQWLLPAFSLFTGGWPIDHAQARYGCMGRHIVDLGPTRPPLFQRRTP